MSLIPDRPEAGSRTWPVSRHAGGRIGIGRERLGELIEHARRHYPVFPAVEMMHAQPASLTLDALDDGSYGLFIHARQRSTPSIGIMLGVLRVTGVPRARGAAAGVKPSRIVAAPLWREIADDITRRIAAGVLTPGDELPSQAELAETWQCSLTPVKRAIAHLDTTGAIVARPGMRARVASPKG